MTHPEPVEAEADLIARTRVQAQSWRRDDCYDAREPQDEAAFFDELADALTSRDERIAELEREVQENSDLAFTTDPESGASILWRELFEAERAKSDARDARAIKAEALLEEAVKGLERAEQFIVNGVELGFIRLPETSTDPAHETLPAIRQALSTIRACKEGEG